MQIKSEIKFVCAKSENADRQRERERERERERKTDILRMPVQSHAGRGAAESQAQIYRKSATNCCARISLHMSYSSQREGKRGEREKSERGKRVTSAKLSVAFLLTHFGIGFVCVCNFVEVTAIKRAHKSMQRQMANGNWQQLPREAERTKCNANGKSCKQNAPQPRERGGQKTKK